MRAANWAGFGVLILFFGLWTACRDRSDQPGPAERAGEDAGGGATNRQVYRVEGVIREVLAEGGKLKIDHEEIPGFMGAMVMTFDVRGGGDLAVFSPGDKVRFTMVVTPEEGWIEGVTKVGEAALAPAFRVVRDVEPLAVGDLLPEYHFTNQVGQAVSLGDFRGQALGLTFLFTRCSFPNFCPRMAGNFAAAQQQLKAMSGGPTNWHLLTITFDPEHDTPAVLQVYGRNYQCDPQRWSFLTGNLVDITALAEQFGLMFWRSDPTDPVRIDHNLRTVVIDVNGRVRKIIPENEWKVAELVSEMVKAAGVPRM